MYSQVMLKPFPGFPIVLATFWGYYSEAVIRYHIVTLVVPRGVLKAAVEHPVPKRMPEIYEEKPL